MTLEQAIERELRTLRKIVDCADCPEDRHCCIFENKYGLSMTKKTAELLFGEDLPNLKADGRIETIGKRVILKNGRCPLLDEGNACSVYDKREAVGLSSCIKYPIFLSKQVNKTRLVIDYRCTFVEDNWELIRNSVKEIVGSLFEIVVVYRNNRDTYQKPIDKFEEMLQIRRPSQEK